MRCWAGGPQPEQEMSSLVSPDGQPRQRILIRAGLSGCLVDLPTMEASETECKPLFRRL